MRRIEFIVGGMLWFAATMLMPMAALEPVQATSAPTVAAQL